MPKGKLIQKKEKVQKKENEKVTRKMSKVKSKGMKDGKD